MPVRFTDGLNVVLAEIRLPQNKDKDTHNLGKSTLGRLIDFTLLARKSQSFFLFKHQEMFESFVFFLEIELKDGSFLTVRRSVEEGSKASFKLSTTRDNDFSNLSENEWDHYNVPFERAKSLLDGYLAWRAIKPWDYRKVLGYYLRTQEDYQDVFQLRKFAGSHADWKPVLAHVLGFDAQKIIYRYEQETLRDKKERKVADLEDELGNTSDDLSTIEGLLQIKKEEASQTEVQLENFDFRESDKDTTDRIVDEIDGEIANLNERKYSLRSNKKKIESAIRENRITFSSEEASSLFEEVEVYFGGQLKKNFDQLLEFNQAITEERSRYLKEDLKELSAELETINGQLEILGKQRSDALSFLSETEVFEKYRNLSAQLVELKSSIDILETRRDHRLELQAIRAELRGIEEELGRLAGNIEEDVASQNADSGSTFSNVRRYFNEIVSTVLGWKALLSVSVNKENHLEFKASFLDDENNVTSADAGSSYKRLLCVAFDLAVLRAHIHDDYPRFAFHDGVFETLDPRKKTMLLEVLRDYGRMGLQLIATTIDSELPDPSDGEESVLTDDEIVVRLHDEGMEGRLFKMQSW